MLFYSRNALLLSLSSTTRCEMEWYQRAVSRAAKRPPHPHPGSGGGALIHKAQPFVDSIHSSTERERVQISPPPPFFSSNGVWAVEESVGMFCGASRVQMHVSHQFQAAANQPQSTCRHISINIRWGSTVGSCTEREPGCFSPKERRTGKRVYVWVDCHSCGASASFRLVSYMDRAQTSSTQTRPWYWRCVRLVKSYRRGQSQDSHSSGRCMYGDR